MINFKARVRGLRVLDADSECRPLAWYAGDFVTKQPTAIAWRWTDGKKTYVKAIGESYDTRKVLDEELEMLLAFRAAYDAADVVTGHFLRGFDLPLLSGALVRLGQPPLGKKLTQDTKLDAFKRTGMSMSQENLGAMFELEHPKYPMNTALWGMANMLLPEGIALTKKRVVADVEQHVEMRDAMLAQDSLGPPRLWTPDGAGVGGYHA